MGKFKTSRNPAENCIALHVSQGSQIRRESVSILVMEHVTGHVLKIFSDNVINLFSATLYEEETHPVNLFQRRRQGFLLSSVEVFDGQFSNR